MEKPLEVPNSEPKINELVFEPEINELGVEPDPEITKIGFFEPITEDPMYNWIWTDIDDNDYEYNEDDLRDPDMTTVSGTGSDFSGTGIASSAVLRPEFPYPTLEPGFDILSGTWPISSLHK